MEEHFESAVEPAADSAGAAVGRFVTQWVDGLYRAVGKLALNAPAARYPVKQPEMPLPKKDKYVRPLDKSKIKLTPMTREEMNAIFASNLARGIVAELKPNQFD